MLESDKNLICNRMGVKSVDTHTRYLGLLVSFGRSKKDVFSFVTNKIWKNIEGWKEKCLSKAGKETLIKAIAQAIPNYIMSCYKFLECTCHEIEAMHAKFWWGSSDEAQKVHSISWEKMSKDKNKGGMRFRGFSGFFNKALLRKHCWRLMTKEGSLMERIFKARYYPRSSFMDAKPGFQPSYAWRSILSAKDIISQGSQWQIGNGSKVRIWSDIWLPEQSSFKVLSPRRFLRKRLVWRILLTMILRDGNRILFLTISLAMKQSRS